MIKAKFIGSSHDISFTVGKVYECEKGNGVFGEYYDILDDSGEWYEYGIKYFEKNFEIVS